MKSFPKLTKGDIVLVKWLDTSDGVEWIPQDSVPDWDFEFIASVGVFLEIDGVKFKMAHSVAGKDLDGITIHTATIESVEILKKKK